MNILGIDTSAKTVSVAIGNAQSILAEANATTRLTHSQTLMPLLEAVLQSSGLVFADIDCFAVSVGPGSFTGLRIGIGAVKGMAYGAGKPCVGVSTLDALARNLPGTDGIICTAMDARCSQLYTALFDSTPERLSRRTDDAALTLSELEEQLSAVEKNIFFVGDGAQLCYNTFIERLPRIFLAGDGCRMQRAASVILAAREKAAVGEFLSAAELAPVYLRLPQAERELKKRQAAEK